MKWVERELKRSTAKSRNAKLMMLDSKIVEMMMDVGEERKKKGRAKKKDLVPRL